MRSSLLLSPVVVFAAACAVSAGTVAAYTAVTGNFGNSLATGSVALSDNGNDQTLLTLQDAGLGSSVSECIRVRSDGSLPSVVRLRAESTGALAPHLSVKITRGSGAAAFQNCSGFTADPRDHYGLGSGVVYQGRLSDLPSQWQTALHDPSSSLPATAVMPLLSARGGMVGLWELGERTRRADAFTGTPGALLDSRPELQTGSWVRQSSSTTNAVLTPAGRLRPEQSGIASYRVTSATGAEIVTAQVNVQTATGDAGVMTRMTTGADRGYVVRYRAAGIWELARVDDGAITVLDAWTHAIPEGSSGQIALRHTGDALLATITGPTGTTHQLSATDATYPETARTGVRLHAVGAAGDLEGIQLDDFRVYNDAQATSVASVGAAATVFGSTPSTPNLQPSASDQQAAAVFNGSSQALSLPAAGVTTSATVGGWFRLETGGAIMRDSTSGPADGWSLGYDDGSGTMKFRVSGTVFDTGIAFAPLRNVWRHHALVRNGSAVEYYLDGRRVFAGTVAATTAPAAPWIVMRDGATTDFSSGRADQIAIWSRALGADELAAIHDGIAADAQWHEGDHAWYRVQVTVADRPEAADKTGTARFTWEAHSR